MVNRKLLLSIFNIAARTYSSQIIAINSKRALLKYSPAPNSYCIPHVKMSGGDNLFANFDEVKCLGDNKNVLLIDVREPAELQETGIIPGSINIPLGEVENVLKNSSECEFQQKYCRTKPDCSFPLVFSCRSGKRSTMAAEIATKLGFSNVRNYAGGWLDWEKNIKQ